MAQKSTITVNDGAATPVSNVFTVHDRVGTKSIFRNFASALVRGQKIFTHEPVIGQSAKSANRALMTLTVPHEGTVDGVLTVIGQTTCRVDINFHPSLNEDARKAIYGLLANLVSEVDVKAQSIALSALAN